MLRELHIRDYALIEQLDLEFQDGFTVLTGETGAGKSIILDCLGLLLGQRARAESVRAGCEVALVEGGFELPDSSKLREYLSEAGLEPDDQYLVISREISRLGRSKCRINGRMATVSMLSDLAPYLVEMHGQHDNQLLLDSESHVNWLDQLGGTQVAQLLNLVDAQYRVLVQKVNQFERFRQSERERVQRLDLLRFQLTEINEARLKPGEDEELMERRKFLQNVERLMGAVQESYILVSGGVDMESTGARDLLAKSVERLREACTYDKSLSEPMQALETALYSVEEAISSLRNYVGQVQVDPAELNDVETRLNLIQQLKRKYGDTVLEILKYRDEVESEIQELENSDITASQLEDEIEEIRQALASSVQKLSQARRQIARHLEKAVEVELAQLNMEKASFVVEFGQYEGGQTVQTSAGVVAVRANGADRVQFLISANPGEAPQPLSKVASGGELARVMLALKSVLAQVDTVRTLVFDEVDTGIGGKTALAVAQRLAQLGTHKQVLCVTHLPQVAAAAVNHLLVEKHTGDDGRTRVTVRSLSGPERLQELGRMLGGRQTEVSLSHAAELINLGERWRNLTA